MEEFLQQPQIKQEGFVSVEESRKIAQKLLTKYDSEITAQSGKDINDWKKIILFPMVSRKNQTKQVCSK